MQNKKPVLQCKASRILKDRMTKDLSTEERILEAAKQVFLRDGYHAARMEDIAQIAGVKNKASLHYYFRTKDKLFEAIFQQLKGAMLPRVAEIFKSNLPLFEKIRLFVEGYIDLICENPYVPLFLINEVNKDPEKFIQTVGVIENVQSFMPYLIVQLQEEIDNGKVRPIHPMHLFMNVISMCAFPFLAKPLMQRAAGMSDAQYMGMMQDRKKIITEFVINSIKT